MKKPIAQTLLAGGLLACSVLAHAGLSGSVAITSDYRFRGISQTDESLAVQGSLTATHDASGLYAGFWGSNVDFMEAAAEDAQLELDLYAGWKKSINDNLSYDVGAVYYAYPNSDPPRDFEYIEVYGALTYNFLTLKYYYSPDFFFETDAAHYIDLSASYGVAENFTLVGHIGSQYIDDNDSFGVDDYIDYKLGVATEILGLGAELAYIGTDIDDEDCFGGAVDWCDGTALLTFSKAF